MINKIIHIIWKIKTIYYLREKFTLKKLFKFQVNLFQKIVEDLKRQSYNNMYQNW